VPYNSLRGNPYFDVDARLAKNIKLGEHKNLQLVFQAFNVFNHANYGNSFDNVNATLDPKSKNSVANPNPGFTDPNDFINPASTTLPRAFTAEFGARFTF
jgi:hypothetical protein